ncbi:MAG: AbrB/MazE/SpoVT family DNA-binding domain-containing protein [Candidatus Margulisbacteria bacterium]|nr:AbrB/MazE/SpoVT family DNA-binding domain-containing protein [Candidatus Margulisiibacteriota bacterium]
MATYSSSVTKKGQATVPIAVRKAFDIHEGDKLVWVLNNLSDKTVNVRKATPIDLEFAASVSATMSEWDSPEDNEAYNDL